MHDENYEQDKIVATLLKLPEAAQQLVGSWTKGLTKITLIRPDADRAFSVCTDSLGRYYVTAYFTVGGTWAASADAQGVHADAAFRQLALRMS